MSEEKRPAKRKNLSSYNSTEEQNIRKAITDFVKQNQSIPSKAELSKITGTTPERVERAYSRMIQICSDEEVLNLLKIFTPEILISVKDRAKSGNVQAQKLFFDLLDRYSPNSNNKSGNSNIQVIKIEGQEIYLG